MQSTKTEFLTKYNNLLNKAIKGHSDFPDKLCDFFTDEYDLLALVLFQINDNEKLVVLGKSNSAKKSFTPGSVFDCTACNAYKNGNGEIVVNSQPNCTLEITDFVLYECCTFIKSIPNNLLFKVAKKTPLTQSDKSNLEILASTVENLIRVWKGNEGNYNTSLSRIIAEIAHELRTPTNSIMGFASLLNEDNLSPSQAEYVSTLKESAYNLLSLLNDVIDIAKVDTGAIKESVSNINIRNFINDILKLFTDKIDRNLLDFIIKIDDKIPETIKIDIQKLRYVLVNIITYCIRLTEKGRITVIVSLIDNDKINIKLSDTSSGFSNAKLKNLFLPFSLSENGNQKFGTSTGLGLTLSKRYIDLINGDIEVTSSLSKGTTYNITLKTEVLSSIEKQISGLPKDKKNNRVLVVEDDYATSKLLSNYLNKWGYEPLIVNSADQTMKIIENENFLAILMDIVLPDCNGFELLKNVREHKNTKRTPVIVCSVEAEQQKAFLMGAVEYFVKPIKYNHLVEVLHSYKLRKDSEILIVDDDVPTLNLIKEAVQQAGFKAIAESKSSRVINLIGNINPDLAIIDLDMPEVNGFELIKQLKAVPKFSKLPIVIYTGKENYQDDLKKIDGLFEELLEKNSSNIEDLADTVTEMINRFDLPANSEEPAEKDEVKILLVEDYKHSQIIVTRLLKKNNFNHIVVVENGAEALEQVKKQHFDIILMDMQMPVMNGFEATEKIRQLVNYKDTPIIALTAFAMKGDREKCLEAGATDYIPKPIDSHEFIEKVKHYSENKAVPVAH